MKFLHTSDLHLGKTVNDFSMVEDQKFMLRQILGIVRAEAVDAVVIAGDVYDRSIPPAEAVLLLDSFLGELAAEHIPVLMISGNHDSPERLSFASRPLEQSGIYIAGGMDEPVREVVLQDGAGDVHFFLLPFLKPAGLGEKTSEGVVNSVLPEVDRKNRNVLVTHYFVTAGGRIPELSESESGVETAKFSVDVGGIDHVDAALFERFDYTALGHIHKAQKIGEQEVYYSGAPLAYSFSEAGAEKSVQLVTLLQKGEVMTERRILHPLHAMRILQGTMEELMEGAGLPDISREDYIQARLTDKEELIDPIGTLRSVYPNVMQIVFAGREERKEKVYEAVVRHRFRTTQELFAQFYELVRGEDMSRQETELIDEVVEELEDGR